MSPFTLFQFGSEVKFTAHVQSTISTDRKPLHRSNYFVALTICAWLAVCFYVNPVRSHHMCMFKPRHKRK